MDKREGFVLCEPVPDWCSQCPPAPDPSACLPSPAGTKGLQPDGARGEHAPPGAAPAAGCTCHGLRRTRTEVRVRGGPSLFPRLGPNHHPPCQTLASSGANLASLHPPTATEQRSSRTRLALASCHPPAAARSRGANPAHKHRDRHTAAATPMGTRVWRDAKETLTLRINLYFNM